MNRTVLVVEDEFDSQEVVRELLEYMDIDAIVVREAEEALFRLESETFDGVLIDLALPGMDGLMLLKAIRQTPNLDDLPCIIVTAFNSGEVKRDAFTLGCNAFITKPIKNDSFVKEVSHLIKKRV